jgi:hypothetical protein
MKRVYPLLLAICLALLTASCSRIRIEQPEGFAEIKGGDRYRAISPEGMLLGVRTVKNYPKKDLDFWAEALRNQLEKEGYKLISGDETFQVGERKGVLYEWGVPLGNESYIYLTAIVVMENRIAIAEAGGEHTVYRRYKNAILKSLETLKFRRFLFL